MRIQRLAIVRRAGILTALLAPDPCSKIAATEDMKCLQKYPSASNSDPWSKLATTFGGWSIELLFRSVQVANDL